MREPERMVREIRRRDQEREERRRSELMTKEIEELKDCTFQPMIPSYPRGNNSATNSYITNSLGVSTTGSFINNNSGGKGSSISGGNTTNAYGESIIEPPIVIRGLGRHLELMNMSVRQKEEVLRREREAFHVKNADRHKRTPDGSTVIEVPTHTIVEDP
jgi:hypothetical protein